MEKFYQTICYGVVGGCPNPFGSEQPYQLLLKVELELSSSISCDDGGNSKLCNLGGKNVLATVSAVMSAIGIASGQHVKWSTRQQVCETI